jgi:hypothetical protein
MKFPVTQNVKDIIELSNFEILLNTPIVCLILLNMVTCIGGLFSVFNPTIFIASGIASNATWHLLFAPEIHNVVDVSLTHLNLFFNLTSNMRYASTMFHLINYKIYIPGIELGNFIYYLKEFNAVLEQTHSNLVSTTLTTAQKAECYKSAEFCCNEILMLFFGYN